MRLFDLSFDGNKFYISCTRDMQRRDNPREDIPGVTSPCDRDNSGPQNLKACVADHVCYMYRWSERNFDYLSHNKEPKGMDKWDEPPFNITAEDIITSSVLSKLQGIERGESGDSLSNILKSTKGGLSSLSDPRNPGVFHIPICFSRQNWNTQVTGWNTFCDTDPHCPAKNFPCFCGSWGKETDSVWRGMGVGQDNKRRNYVQHLCPRQISRKVADPLERYMAYCALDIRRNTCGTRVNGLTKYAGKDKYCQLFESVMEHKGFESIMDMDPEIKFAFTCKIKKGGKGCSMYDNMFEGLWMDAIDEGFLRFEDKPKNLP
ncbi:hypothetical protein L873DRAFT_704438 [Choiromyces venosus 120613-1]|uniref:Uncharacterized protein n=1 Tax=Choiromyces venosus 120613-1 TaxID=1336337 RepID=A0A3N4ISS5_9PEZI|nr:hypothetical protein L873DRAFT_704438 [Choiromyces venosus 120613-1]